MRGTIDSSDSPHEPVSPDSGAGADALSAPPDWLERLVPIHIGIDPASQGLLKLSHVSGTAATLAALRAQVRRSRTLQEHAAEREGCWKLATHLVYHGYDLPRALQAGHRTLELRDDDAVREMLSFWLQSCGEQLEAAAMLRPSVGRAPTPPEAARLLMRIAGLYLSVDERASALNTLLEAAACCPTMAEPLETAGALGAAMQLSQAPLMLLQAADRHDAQGDHSLAFAARHRAFDLAPDNLPAVEALVETLDRVKRFEAADQVLRTHAFASDPDRAKTVHALRLDRALRTEHLASALSVILDAQFEPILNSPVCQQIDQCFAQAELPEMLAARWELQAAAVQGPERASVLVHLAELYQHQLGSPDRAMDAWIQALAADPQCEPARQALVSLPQSDSDPCALLEALIQASQNASEGAVRKTCLHQLAAFADQSLHSPALEFWALSQLLDLGQSDTALEQRREALITQVREQDAAIGSARKAATNASDDRGRVESLRTLALFLRGRPAQLDDYLRVLTELVEANTDERRWAIELEWACRRAGRLDGFERTARRRLERGLSQDETIRLRMSLVLGAVRRTDYNSALNELLQLQRQAPHYRPALLWGWMLTSMQPLPLVRAQVLEAAASCLSAELRATVQAYAGQLYLELGQELQAKQLAFASQQSAPSQARVLLLLADLVLHSEAPDVASQAEKAWAVLLPDSRHHQALARAFKQAGDDALAHTWTRRWYELRPWDRNVLEQLVLSSIATNNAELLVETLNQMVVSVLSIESLAPLLDHGLRAVAALAPQQAASLCRALLALTGPKDGSLRSVLLEVARMAQDSRLEIAVLERWLASTDQKRDPRILCHLADLYQELGDADGEALSVMRAQTAGLPAQEVLARIDQAIPSYSGDAVIVLAQARARALEALGADRLTEASRAWCQAAAGLWDLAQDPHGAMLACRRAAQLQGKDKPEMLAGSVAAFAGAEAASQAIAEYAKGLPQASDSAAFLVLAAVLALRTDSPEVALTLAQQALDRDIQRTDALVVIETAASRLSSPEKIDQAYERVAIGARGRFGRRAAHYRAARVLESHGRPELAVVHAMAAFEADPTSNSSMALMLRLASHIEPSEVIDTLTRVSESEADPELKAYWLRKAASVAASSATHLRSALDLTLRAMLASPDTRTVELLSSIASRILKEHPLDREILELRLARAHKALSSKLQGPIGARVAIALSRMSAEQLQSAELGHLWLESAWERSADVAEYATLEPLAALLASAAPKAESFLDSVLKSAKQASSPISTSAFSFAKSLANALRDDLRHMALEQIRPAASPTGDPSTDSQPAVFVELGEELSEADLLGVVEAQPQPAAPAPIAAPIQPLPIVQTGGLIKDAPLGDDTIRDAMPTMPSMKAITESSEVIQKAKEMEDRGLIDGAISLLESEAQHSPANQAQLDEALRRLYTTAKRDTKLFMVLGRMIDRSSDAKQKLELLIEVAERMQARGDVAGAHSCWSQVIALDGKNPKAIDFLQEQAQTRGDYTALVEVLGFRARASSSPDEIRKIRIQRALVLEQKLGRAAQACEELDAVLTELGEDPSVLSVMAEIVVRSRGTRSAAPYWLRAARVTSDKEQAVALACKAATAFLDIGNEAAAREALSWVGETRTVDVLRVMVRLERRGGNPLVLGDLLDALASAAQDAKASVRAHWLMEGAEAALAAGQLELAYIRAQRALPLVPDDARLQLRGLFIEYRVKGLSPRARVVEMLSRLDAITGRLRSEDIPLQAFLCAELLDKLQGPQAALKLLTDKQRQVGLKPLIALGMAEHMSALGSFQEALSLFDIALGAEELQGVRTRAQITFAAARAALRASGPSRAAPYITELERHPEADELLKRLRTEMANPASARTPLPPTPPEGVPSREEPRAQPTKPPVSAEPAQPSTGTTLPPLPPAAAPVSPPVPLVPSPVVSVGSTQVPVMPSGAMAPEARPFLTHLVAEDNDTLVERNGPSHTIRPLCEPEEKLLKALEQGDIGAGHELAGLIAKDPSRSHELVAVRRRQVVLGPADVELLELLHQAAVADRSWAHAHAVEHAICVLNGTPAIAAPGLGTQREDPERLLSMVFRGVRASITEALEHVWENAPHLFARDASSYGLTGLERVALMAPSPVGRAFNAASRALGLTRTPVFQRKSTNPTQMAVALMLQPAVVVTGETKDDSAELVYRMASMLAATVPANALLFGLPAPLGRSLVLALEAAFGPPSPAQDNDIMLLASELWRALPGRVQRRMHELFRSSNARSYDDAWARALQSTRRAGLFVVGDLATALRDTLQDPGIRDHVSVSSPDALRTACGLSASAADLVRFATSAEFAEARWHEVSSWGPRSSTSP